MQPLAPLAPATARDEQVLARQHDVHEIR